MLRGTFASREIRGAGGGEVGGEIKSLAHWEAKWWATTDAYGADCEKANWGNKIG